MLRLDSLRSAYEQEMITQVIRPAAVIPEQAAKVVLEGMAQSHVHNGGKWYPEAMVWNRFDRPWDSPDSPGNAGLLGSIEIVYGFPGKYDITIYRVSVTRLGSHFGFGVNSLTDEALRCGGLTLATCPRTEMEPPPQPFAF